MTTKVLIVTTILVAAAGAVVWLSLPQTSTPATQPVAQPAAIDTASNGLDYRGIAIQVASGYRPVERYGKLIEEIADLGANTVLLSVAGHMEHAGSQSIFIESRKVPSPDEFKQIIRKAKSHDLKVVIMPIVLLKNPRGNEWRGLIDPPSWEVWWNEYREFVLYFADIAREGQADALIIGSELISTERQTERWQELIEAIRPRFHGGKLGYSANWDHYRPIEFWDKLDFIGMTSYYTLADKKSPTVAALVAKWKPIRTDILAWQRQIGKPILMTEVGWCSQEGAATAPWNYYQDQRATPAGMEEQRRLYEAFIRVWNDTPQLMGVIWWEWSESPGGTGDFGYTPKNKPAETLLRQWFQTTQTQPTTAPSD